MELNASGIWRTDTTALLNLYRRALLVLLPIADEAKIPWRDPEAYDDWDAIAEVLFEQIVVRPIRWSLPDGERDAARFAPYGMQLKDYSSVSFIDVNPGQAKGLFSAFHGLATTAEPFDTVLFTSIDQRGQVIDHQILRTLLRGAEFCFQWRTRHGELRQLAILQVQL